MELASAEPSSGSALAKEVYLSASTSHQPAPDKRAGSDAAFGPPVERRPLHEQPPSEREQQSPSEESSSRGESLTRLCFLKKLWDIVESSLFDSIWWGDKRKYIVINEDLFEEEVLERRGRQKIFDSETMESFTQELHEHGFTGKVQGFPNSGPVAGELHFYCTPDFRHFPHLLLKRPSFPKTQMAAGFSPPMELNTSSRKRKAEHDLVWETNSKEDSSPFTGAPRENTPTSAPRATPPARPSAKLPKTAPLPCQNSNPAATPGREESTPVTPFATAQQSWPSQRPGCCSCRPFTQSHHSQQPLPSRAGTSHLSSPAGKGCCCLCQGHRRAHLHHTTPA